MKTKPFNLEEALAGARVVTRDGNEVTQLYKFDADEDHCLIGVSNGRIFSWTTNGKYLDTCKQYEKDLFIAVEINNFWVNVYKGKDGNISLGPKLHTSKEEAEAWKWKDNYIKTIEITDEP